MAPAPNTKAFTQRCQKKVAGWSCAFGGNYKLFDIHSWIYFVKSKIFYGKISVWMQFLPGSEREKTVNTAVVVNLLAFYTKNSLLLFQTKRSRHAPTAASRRACWLQLSVSCQEHGFKLLLQSRHNGKLNLQVSLLGPGREAIKHSGVCFLSSCLSQRTSKGLEVPFMQTMM